MAAKKPTDKEPSALELEDVFTADQLSPAIEQLCNELGIDATVGQAVVYVSLIMPDQAKEARVWNGAPDEYDLMAIARKHGSGDYRVKIYLPTERGNPALRGNRILTVQLDPAEDARIARLRRGEPETPQQGLGAADISKMIAEAIKTALPVVTPQPQANPMGLIKEVAEIVKTMMPQPAQQSQINPLEVFKIAAEFARGSDLDPIDRGVNATPTDVFMRLIDRFAPLFADTLKTQTGSATAALPAPSEPGKQPPQANASGITKEQEEAVNKLRIGIQFLVMQAEAGNDPETYADVVLDNVPEDSLQTFLQNPQPVEYLAQFVPDALKYKEWFEKLIVAVKESLVEEPQPPTTEGADNAKSA